ncbi:MAG: YccF family protein [Treponematales bacterium]
MATIGNVIWFVFGGELMALAWLVFAGIFAVTVVGLPIARACLEFAKLSAFPFGKEVIRDTELKGAGNVSGFSKVVSLILNIIWFPIGLCLTVIYLVLGIVSFVTIIGIPVGIVYVRMGAFVLFPIGARVVSKKQANAAAVANELERRAKK